MLLHFFSVLIGMSLDWFLRLTPYSLYMLNLWMANNLLAVRSSKSVTWNFYDVDYFYSYYLGP